MSDLLVIDSTAESESVSRGTYLDAPTLPPRKSGPGIASILQPKVPNGNSSSTTY